MDPHALIERDLADRYGTHRPRRRLVLIVVTVLVAGAALGWLAWAAWVNSNPAVSAAVVSFDVRSEHRVVATVQVRLRDRYERGTCLLRATASDHSVVGELTMQALRSGTTTAAVRTEREATTVEVIRCGSV